MQSKYTETKPMSLRVPVELRAALDAKAKETRRSVTSLVLEGMERVVETPPKAPTSFYERVKAYEGTGREGEGLDAKGMAERMKLIRGDD